MERVVQWLRARPPFAPLEPLFVGNQKLKALDPNLTYFQRRKLVLEIKEEFRDAADGPLTATSTAPTTVSTPLDTLHTPPPTSAGSPVLQRLGSNQRVGGGTTLSTPTPPIPSTSSAASASTSTSISAAVSAPYANPNWSSNSLAYSYGPADHTAAPSIVTAVAAYFRSPRDDGMSAPSSAVNTPVFHGIDVTSRPSMDALEPLDHLPLSPTLAPATPPQPYPPPKVPGLSPRPLSDPDLAAHIFNNNNSKVPTQVFFETTETPVRQPSFGPRQSSVNYNIQQLRANVTNGPPSIAPRTSSREYGLSYGFNGVGRGLVPGSPSSPAVSTSSNKTGPSLNERRNTPSALHIQTQSLADPSGYRRINGHGQVSGPELDQYYAPPYGVYPNHAAHSGATVVGGTLGFGRRQSHKRNHSSADVIQYPPPVPPKTPVKPRSIQVTMDNENFKRLDVSAVENASLLKKLIFEKLEILAEREKYGIFETTELGSALVDATSHGGPQLTDAQLLELATTADNKGTTKLLVTPIKPLILPRDLDLMNPQRPAASSHGRNSPYQHPSYQYSQAQNDMYHPHSLHAHAPPLHARDKTYESPHMYRDDPYLNSFAHQSDEAWGSIHPHQPAYPDSKHPHASNRHPTPFPPLPGPSSANGTPPYGGYQQQMYRFVNDPGHPHYQGDGGPSSARTSPRVGPVVNTAQARMMGAGGGVPSPGIDGSAGSNVNSNGTSGQARYSPLANRKALAGNPRLSLVIGSNTDQEGKLLTRTRNDHSASPGGTLGHPPRSHNGRAMTPNAYKNHSPGASPYAEMNRSGPLGLGEISPFGFGGNVNSSGFPASPLSAGGKRSSYQNIARYTGSNPNSPRSAHLVSSETGSGDLSGDHDDYREIKGSPLYSNNGHAGSTFNLHFLGAEGGGSHPGIDGTSGGAAAINNGSSSRSPGHMDDNDSAFWGERPPLDFMLENFPQFFQGYDMDHPLIELQPPTPFTDQSTAIGSNVYNNSGNALPTSDAGVMGGNNYQGSQGSFQQQLRGGQGQATSEVASPATTTDGWGSNSTMVSSGHPGESPYAASGSRSRGSITAKKSIRIVAQEAKDRFSKQFSGSNIGRRKSTKMWGSRLAEVVPTHATPVPPFGLGVQEEGKDEEEEHDRDHEQPDNHSPFAGSPDGVINRASIASMVEEAAQAHHILPPKEVDHGHVPNDEDAASSDVHGTGFGDQHVPESVPTPASQQQVVSSHVQQQQQQQQQQRRSVVHVDSGKVIGQSQQGIYQHPQSGAIRTFRYLKGGLIGRGSFGRVYHAFNVDTGEMIAVKQVDLPTTLSERNCDRLKTSVEALFAEMEVLKDLEHENIVQYLGFSQNDDTANIFLEYVSGGSIESCLKRSGPFPEAVIKFFSRQILLGLEYIHSKRIVHRDIKAANVLVDEQGTCKISDFGISKRNAASQGGYDENVGSLQGSVFWMAPEMVTSKAYGAKVDIWSFGCLVLEMFTGKQPWNGYAPQQALFTIGSSSAHPPIPETICEEGQRFLARCFITDANLRPTAAELLQDEFVAEQPNFKFSDYIEGKMDSQ
ncbi:hypothetical protein BGW41_004200 [Actinomortierella wolfii]|nr:hypothetical protein BGW41_004200 [Actinomortierella wolfii]